jgi:hypothetical protein
MVRFLRDIRPELAFIQLLMFLQSPLIFQDFLLSFAIVDQKILGLLVAMATRLVGLRMEGKTFEFLPELLTLRRSDPVLKFLPLLDAAVVQSFTPVWCLAVRLRGSSGDAVVSLLRERIVLDCVAVPRRAVGKRSICASRSLRRVGLLL